MSDEKPAHPGPYPESDERSFAYHTAMTTLDAAASVVPGGSFAVGQIIRRFVGEPLEKRRDEWFTAVGLGLEELQIRMEGFDPSILAENEEFISTVYEATHLAMKTHRKEKLEILMNAVLNTAAGFSLDEVERSAFLLAVDRYTEAHIIVLRMMSESSSSKEYMSFAQSVVTGSKSEYIGKALGEKTNPEVVSRIIGDLRREDLVDDTASASVLGSALVAKSITAAGDRFLRFVSRPAGAKDV